MNKEHNVVTRIAPSPTGKLHAGLARTALFNYCFAKKHSGKFLIRIEDTDTERSKKEYEEDILESLSWLGLCHDGEIIRQSERTKIYSSYIQKLLDSGNAYVSTEEMKKEGNRSEVIRFKNPKSNITFTDEIRGEIVIDISDLGDFVIAKDINTPLYHLAVVIDDFESGVTHIIRGDDGISNTPRQILIQEAIGAPRPIYGHLPLILASDKSKLSKRHGAPSINEYRELGYSKDAIINFLGLLGWHPKDDREFLSLTELVDLFELSDVSGGGAIFDEDKLNWLNRHYLRNDKDISTKISSALPDNICIAQDADTAIRDNMFLDHMNVLTDINTLIAEGGKFSFLVYEPEIKVDSLVDPKSKPDATKIKEHLKYIISSIEPLNDEYSNPENIKNAVWDYASDEGRGAVLWPFRFALTGKKRSPDPFTVAALLGKEKTLARLKKAYDIL